jgi:histidine triad (HIT) family protein
MSFKNDCIFCKIIKGEIPSQKVFENEKVIGFRDISPNAKVHCLFAPKFHVESLAQVKDTSILSDLYGALVEVAKREGVLETGFRSVINTGRDGGQTVPHLHLHLIGGQQLSARMS